MWLGRWKRFDWTLLGALCLMAAASLVALSSASPALLGKQATWFALGFAIILFGSQVDWRWLIGRTWFRFGLYWLSVALLVVSNLQGGQVRGTKSWLLVGSFQFEPSELAKLALILIFAHFFSRRYVAAWQRQNILATLGYTLLPASLIAVHPDFGSAFIVAVLWLGFLISSGVNKRRLLIGIGVVIAVGALLWGFFLRPYQKDRLVGFLFPERDPLGVNYNIIQSKIAIGSAGWLGKGYGAGTQTQLHFLPETQSDFLFAAFIEEWGLLGGTVLLLTFLLVLYRLMAIGLRARDNSTRFIIVGGGLYLVVHVLINVGANVGLLPVVGITFPFFSYGGSNLLTTATLFSIIEHIKLESSA